MGRKTGNGMFPKWTSAKAQDYEIPHLGVRAEFKTANRHKGIYNVKEVRIHWIYYFEYNKRNIRQDIGVRRIQGNRKPPT